MAANQPKWPREWLMTDERLGERLWDAIDALPQGAGIVFRHYRVTGEARLELGSRVAERARARDLLFAVAGSTELAEKLGAALVHNPDAGGRLPISLAVHDEPQAALARSAGAALALVGPVHPTRSHPGAPVLGPDRAAALARLAGCPAIALGGMDIERFARLKSAHPGAFHGYAGIDCWLENRLRT
jgi:thiamine-phosphate pyrophosphorylase